MGTCLVTTLKESVNDDTLLKLGEGRIKVLKRSDGAPSRFGVAGAYNGTFFTVQGDAYITDETGTSNLGKETPCKAGTTSFYIKLNGDECNVIFEKSAIQALGNYGTTSVNRANNQLLVFDLSDLMYYENLDHLNFRGATVTGKLSDLNSFEKPVIYFDLSYTPVEGDISDIKNTSALEAIILQGNKISGNISCLSSIPTLNQFRVTQSRINGNISVFTPLTEMTTINVESNYNITGDLSSVSSLTNLTQLRLGNNPAITGNISSLARLTNLTALTVNDTAVIGDTSALRNLTNLTTFNYANTAITGNWPLV